MRNTQEALDYLLMSHRHMKSFFFLYYFVVNGVTIIYHVHFGHCVYNLWVVTNVRRISEHKAKHKKPFIWSLGDYQHVILLTGTKQSHYSLEWRSDYMYIFILISILKLLSFCCNLYTRITLRYNIAFCCAIKFLSIVSFTEQ